MKCPHCNFIFRGYVRKCPRCGEILVQSNSLLEKQINFFNWFYITLRTLLVLISINVFLLIFASELFLNLLVQTDFHYTPWCFFGIFFIQYLMLIFSKKRKYYFLFFVLFVLFIGFLFLSYKKYFYGEILTISIVIYYLVPTFSFLHIFLILINQIKNRTYNFLSVSVSSFFSIVIVSVDFGLSFIPSIRLYERAAILTLSIIFIITVLLSVQLIIVAFLKLFSKMNYDNY